MAGKFIQVAAFPSDGSTHPSGIIALDEEGFVWGYEGQYGWVPLNSERHMSIDIAREAIKARTAALTK